MSLASGNWSGNQVKFVHTARSIEIVHRGRPPIFRLMLMKSKGGPPESNGTADPHLERGSASRDNFYGSSGMYKLYLIHTPIPTSQGQFIM